MDNFSNTPRQSKPKMPKSVFLGLAIMLISAVFFDHTEAHATCIVVFLIGFFFLFVGAWTYIDAIEGKPE